MPMPLQKPTPLNSPKAKFLKAMVMLCYGLMITIFALMGTVGTWPPLAGYLPTETVPVKVIDKSTRESSAAAYRHATSSTNYSVEVIDENGTTQAVPCPKRTYQRVDKFGMRHSLQLIRNPTFKTPVAFLQQPESLLDIEEGSVLRKIIPTTPKKTPERLPVIAYPIAWSVFGLLSFGLAIYLVVRVLRLRVSRAITVPVCMVGFLAGIPLGIMWTSSIVS